MRSGSMASIRERIIRLADPAAAMLPFLRRARRL
jgi:hypothetical protein